MKKILLLAVFAILAHSTQAQTIARVTNSSPCQPVVITFAAKYSWAAPILAYSPRYTLGVGTLTTFDLDDPAVWGGVLPPAGVCYVMYIDVCDHPFPRNVFTIGAPGCWHFSTNTVTPACCPELTADWQLGSGDVAHEIQIY